MRIEGETWKMGNVAARKVLRVLFLCISLSIINYQFSIAGVRHRLIVVADPQVYFESELDSVRRAAADIKKTASDGIPTVGIVLGDIIGSIAAEPLLFEPVRDALAESGVPFRYVVGNHDLDVDARSNDDGARRTFNSLFGPGYYSFDLGRVHCVVLDDVFMLARGVTRYVGYIDERQLKWLEEDLANIPPGSTVVVCLHIPTWSRAARRGEWGREELNKVVSNREALYKILEPYNAHIMSGHEHYNENYIPAPHIVEHVHAPLSTLFWQTPWSMDGVPAGYGVYEFDDCGEGDVSWYWKAVDHPRSRQFSAYEVGQDRHKPEAVTVNVWNWDGGWSVEWWENGERRGPMTRYTGYDENIFDYVTRRRAEFKYPYIGAAETEHLFYAVPSTPDARIRVEAKDRFGRVSAWDSTKGYEVRPDTLDYDGPYYREKRDLQEQVAVGRDNTVMLGNSLTERGLWSEYFGPGRAVLNRGIGGDCISGMIVRTGPIVAGQPRAIFIMAGVNDLIFSNITAAHLLRQYERLLDIIERESPRTKIHIQSLLPLDEARSPDWFTGKNARIEAFNALLREMASRRGLIYIDVWSRMARDGRLPGEYTGDGIHLNAAGYAVWSAALKPHIR